MALRTASSSSIGPGMSTVGCASCFDILCFDSMARSRGGCGGSRCGGMCGTSSLSDASRSVEKGVLSGMVGRWSRCREISDKRDRAEAREGARTKGRQGNRVYSVMTGGAHHANHVTYRQKDDGSSRWCYNSSKVLSFTSLVCRESIERCRIDV